MCLKVTFLNISSFLQNLCFLLCPKYVVTLALFVMLNHKSQNWTQSLLCACFLIIVIWKKGYKCFSPYLNRYLLSIDVTFLENTPLYLVLNVCNTSLEDDILLYIVNGPVNSSKIGMLEHETTRPLIIIVYSRRQDPSDICSSPVSLSKDYVPSQLDPSVTGLELLSRNLCDLRRFVGFKSPKLT